MTSIDPSLSTKTSLEHLQSLGIADLPSQNNECAFEKFSKAIMFTDGRYMYMVAWPWRENNPDLPQNYQLVVGRLRSTVYDASSKTKKENKSRDECLYRGPVIFFSL